MKNTTVWGLVAGAAAVTAVLFYKRKEVSRVSEGLMDSARNTGKRLMDYGDQLKNRLLGHIKGPNGEPVYLDMYDRQFYENEMGERVYMES